MRKSTRSLALRIAQILEEHSSDEIADAIGILEKYGYNSDLLRYLAATSGSDRIAKPEKAFRSTSASKPIYQTTSKAVLDLERSDPQKHRILLEFDKLVREGRVLSTNEELRRFGEAVSKEFRPRKSRKDNISAVMSILAPMAQPDVERYVKRALDSASRKDTDEYQNLANFLMHGHRG